MSGSPVPSSAVGDGPDRHGPERLSSALVAVSARRDRSDSMSLECIAPGSREALDRGATTARQHALRTPPENAMGTRSGRSPHVLWLSLCEWLRHGEEHGCGL